MAANYDNELRVPDAGPDYLLCRVCAKEFAVDELDTRERCAECAKEEDCGAQERWNLLTLFTGMSHLCKYDGSYGLHGDYTRRHAMSGSGIITYSGLQLYPWNPQGEAIDIRDAAEALAKECRFNGHCLGFYSVSHHSRMVARNVSNENKLVALLHDLPEAYIKDMPAPIKQTLTGYQELERVLWRALASKLGLPAIIPAEVKLADKRALATERRDIIVSHDYKKFEWPELDGVEPFAELIAPTTGPYDFRMEKSRFLHDFERYEKLR